MMLTNGSGDDQKKQDGYAAQHALNLKHLNKAGHIQQPSVKTKADKQQ